MNTKKQFIKASTRALLISGVASFVFGFLWFVVAVGLPYPDATPDQYASQKMHNSISDWLMLGGLLLFIVGASVKILGWLISRKRIT